MNKLARSMIPDHKKKSSLETEVSTKDIDIEEKQSEGEKMFN
jgi:hypothetical protein